jgi:3-hydroxybutyryl-CoA dehydrogenase
VFDTNAEAVDRAFLDMRRYVDELSRHEMLLGGDADKVYARVRRADSLKSAVAGSDLVVEAIYENVEAKRGLFKELDGLADPLTTIVSNTSSIPIRHMAEVCRHRGRVVGSHFVLPAHILPLVEVIKHPDVDESVIERTRDGWVRMGKRPIVVNVDIPGFVANRLQHALTRQAIELLASGVASAEDIDNAVRFGFGTRFISVGPLGGRDLGGIINHSKVAAYLYEDLDGKGDLGVETLARMAEQGDDGVKTLKGFYDWEGDPAELRDFHYEQMIKQTKNALEIGTVRVKI